MVDYIKKGVLRGRACLYVANPARQAEKQAGKYYYPPLKGGKDSVAILEKRVVPAGNPTQTRRDIMALEARR